MNMFSLLTECQ